MPLKKNKIAWIILKVLWIFFYLAFLFLWFKDNFSSLSNLKIPTMVPLLPLFLLSFVFIFRMIKTKKINLQINKKGLLLVGILLLIACAIRIPFLAHDFGLIDSDDANPILMGKHISEGKTPPLYNYGQEYLGSFAPHIYALMFKLTGYSIRGVLIVSTVFYLCFIISQFLFFKLIFASRNTAFVLCLFYCLPIGHLLAISFHISASFSLVLFLGSLSLYLSLIVYQGNKETLIPFIGFLWGLSFWIHQISLVFTICSLLLIMKRYKLFIRKYIHLAFYFGIGSFPFFLYEIFNKFVTFRFLFEDSRGNTPFIQKMKSALYSITNLISSENNFLNTIYLILLFAGILVIIYSSLKKEKKSPEIIFVIFFFLHLFILIFSQFSQEEKTMIRYSYPFIFVLPVFFSSIFLSMRKNIKYYLTVLLFLFIVLFSNLRTTSSSFESVKKAHFNLKNIVHTLEKSGQTYWAGDFWQVFLVTALSEEKVKGYAYAHVDYPPYLLEYFNGDSPNNNYLFFKEPGSFILKFGESMPGIEERLDLSLEHAQNLIDFIDHFSLKAETVQIREGWLIYDIFPHVPPYIFNSPPPQIFPDLTLDQFEYSGENLQLVFKNNTVSDTNGFRIYVEIPDYSARIRGISLKKEELGINIPFPDGQPFKLKYGLDFSGVLIPSTIREISISGKPHDPLEEKKNIVFLSGVGPLIELEEKNLRICEKHFSFKVNSGSKRKTNIQIFLNSPFDFPRSIWFGEYTQPAKIQLNGHYITDKTFKFGENAIVIEATNPYLKDGENVISLDFKYHLPFKFAPRRKTSMLLEKIEIE